MEIRGKVQISVPPAEMPVSLAEAKAWLRVDHVDDDLVIQNLIAAATAWCETESRRAFVTRTILLSLDGFPPKAEPLLVPQPLFRTTVSFTYYDVDGVLQTWDAEDYQIDSAAEPALYLPAPGAVWPATEAGRVNPVQITYQAGYGTAAQVDPRAKQAVQVLVAHWYENREAVLTGTISKEIELSLRALLRQLWHGVMP